MVVTIGPPLGVVGEYKCQPSASFAVSFSTTLPPGAPVAGSIVQVTGSIDCPYAAATVNNKNKYFMPHPLQD